MSVLMAICCGRGGVGERAREEGEGGEERCSSRTFCTEVGVW